MSEQVVESEVFVDRFYEMNPESEDLISGDQLQNGLVVLIEDSMVREDPERADTSAYSMKRLRENNQWCRVTSLRLHGDLVSFIGVYEDGVKRPRTFNQSYYWIVKS